MFQIYLNMEKCCGARLTQQSASGTDIFVSVWERLALLTTQRISVTCASLVRFAATYLLVFKSHPGVCWNVADIERSGSIWSLVLAYVAYCSFNFVSQWNSSAKGRIVCVCLPDVSTVYNGKNGSLQSSIKMRVNLRAGHNTWFSCIVYSLCSITCSH